MSRVLYACRGMLVTVMPLATFTVGERKTVLSLLSFLLLLGHASLIGRSSTWYLVLHGLASSGMFIARLAGWVGEPRMMRLPSARVYSCGSFRLLWYTSTLGCSSRSGSAMTTTERRPVPSSSSSRSVIPGTRSFHRSSPSTLMMLGSLYGSQVYRMVPRSWPGLENRGSARMTLSPSLTCRMAPSGTGNRLITRFASFASTTRMPSFCSSVADSSSRVSTIRFTPRVPSSYSTVTSAYSSPSVYFTVPSDRARRSASSAMRDDVPPMWNVRSVSCVPGSPMDCAARMPTASPMSTISMVARLRP